MPIYKFTNDNRRAAAETKMLAGPDDPTCTYTIKMPRSLADKCRRVGATHIRKVLKRMRG